MSHLVTIGTILACLLTSAAYADPGDRGTARMTDQNGHFLGTITLIEIPQGILLFGELDQLALGPHGFHVHEVGKCEPPFASAAGHFNPYRKKHGFRVAQGHHAGDLPNVHASSDGKAVVDVMVPGLILTGGPHGILDRDGAAIILHAKADDYETDPAGGSGDRIACGVITATP
jgi:Cu-Zn family superoxide dismutase